MRKWKGDIPPIPLGVLRDDNITVGSMVAVLDRTGDKYYHVARVMDITDTMTTIWYACTKSKTLATAKWKFIYKDPDNYHGSVPVFVIAANVANVDDYRYTGTIPTEDIDDSLILMANLAIIQSASTASFRIDKHSIKHLMDTNLQHHVLGKTWKYRG